MTTNFGTHGHPEGAPHWTTKSMLAHRLTRGVENPPRRYTEPAARMNYYEHNDVVLHNGDLVDVLRRLDLAPDLIITSPPYDGLRDYGGDRFDFEAVADALVGIIPDGGIMAWVVGDGIVDGGESLTSFKQGLSFQARGLRVHQRIIFHKLHTGAISEDRYWRQTEDIFVISNGKPKTVHLIEDNKHMTSGRRNPKNGAGRTDDTIHTAIGQRAPTPEYGRRGNIWTYPVGANAVYSHNAPDFRQAHKHPAIMPLALARDLIRSYSNPGDLVLDPMAGSGTVLRAAKDLGRRTVGIEIYEPYCRLIAERMAQEVLAI